MPLTANRLLISVFALAVFGPTAFADSLFTSVQVAIGAIALTKTGEWSQAKEDAVNQSEAAAEIAEEDKLGLKSVGQTYLNGFSPVYDFSSGPATLSLNLTFSWVDSSTGLPTGGVPVSAVQYYVFTGAAASLDLATDWTLIGTSNNAASDYKVPYSFPFGEYIFLSLPLDGAGHPIVIAGVGGYNDAESIALDTVATPEPGGWGTVFTGLLALWRLRISRSTPH